MVNPLNSPAINRMLSRNWSWRILCNTTSLRLILLYMAINFRRHLNTFAKRSLVEYISIKSIDIGHGVYTPERDTILVMFDVCLVALMAIWVPRLVDIILTGPLSFINRASLRAVRFTTWGHIWPDQSKSVLSRLPFSISLSHFSCS